MRINHTTLLIAAVVVPIVAGTVSAQEVDRVSAPNLVGVGPAKGIVDQLGQGRGSEATPGSALFLITRDPARAVRRGRNLFQRKFKLSEGAGPRTNDGNGPIQDDPSAPVFENSVGAGLADSCALCHGRPRGSAGFGGNVFTRPDSRDAPHLFGLGLQEMLADEMTADLRAIRDAAVEQALNGGGGGGGLNPTQVRILGAESLGDWSLNTGGTISATSNASQGASAIALVTDGWMEIDSAPLGSLNVSDTVMYDFFLPATPPWGEVGVVLQAPSVGVFWSELGPRVQMGTLTPGQYNTVAFPIPAALRATLADATDLRVKIIVNAPNVNGGSYAFDNVVLATDGGGEGGPVTADLVAKGVSFGTITVDENGVVDTSNVQGVDPDLRVRPFFAEGSTISMREFSVGAFNAEMGIQVTDPDIDTAAAGGTVLTPSGMLLDGTIDTFESSPLAEPTDPNVHEPVAPGLPQDAGVALVDFMEFYLLNYFKPGHYQVTDEAMLGRATFNQIGCNDCHRANFTIDRDRRVADVETEYDPVNGVFNNLFATASTRFDVVPDPAFPNQPFIVPSEQSFVVEDIFTDFRRHDLGPELWERNFDDTIHRMFITEPLWGVGSTPPYGHDGRSINLQEIILRHGGEAQAQRDAYVALSPQAQGWVIDFLNTLVLFPPDDTASNLNAPGAIDPSNPDFPQRAHGNIDLSALFQIAEEGPE